MIGDGEYRKKAISMNFLLTLVCTVAGVFILRNPIKRWPWLFYAIAIVLDVLLLATPALQYSGGMGAVMATIMRRGGLGVSLFIVVMYIGVLPRSGKASHWLRPIRAELSITACLLVAGHMVSYLGVYLSQVFTGSVARTNVAVSLAIALVLLVLVILLGVTSLRAVKRHMKARTWKKLQSLAYVFYAGVYIHLMLMLGPAAVSGGVQASILATIYTVVFVLYAVLRLWRAHVDRRNKVNMAETVMDQGFVAEG